MARIRSIKPEFWTSEQVADCSPLARLLFIGLWSFADDAGVHKASLKRLQMEVFPSDDLGTVAIMVMVGELVTAGLLETYHVEGVTYWRVTGWKQHQRIDQPTYRHPLPDGSVGEPVRRRSASKDSTNVRRTLDDRSMRERSGEEWRKEKSPNGDSSTAAARAVNTHTPAPCPHDQIIDLYHELLPTLRRVRDWTPARKKLLRARWREKPEHQHLDWWREFFAYVARCDFLLGSAPPRGGQAFEADLEWLIRPANFVKVLEGRYQQREEAA